MSQVQGWGVMGPSAAWDCVASMPVTGADEDVDVDARAGTTGEELELATLREEEELAAAWC